MPADTEFFYLYGGKGIDEARSIKEIPGGGYILAGTSSSFGQGDASVYLIKTDSMGKHLWSACYGGTQNDWAYSIEVTADSGYFVAGYSNSFNPPNGFDAYYFKTDKNGNLQWQKTVSGTDWDFIYGTTPMPDGGFILCGETYTNSNGGSDAYLIRINKNGDTLWTKHYGGLLDETFNSVTLMNNQIYAVGKNASHATDTIADGWIVKLDTNGTILKDVFISNPDVHFEEILLGITPYSDSTFYFCGKVTKLDSNCTTHIIGKADTALNFLWLSKNGPTSSGYYDSFEHIINISYGGICVIGAKTGGLGGLGMFIVGFDYQGYVIYDYYPTVGGTKDDYGYNGIYTSKGRVIGVGSSKSLEDFCANTNMGSQDVFLVRFNCDSILNGPLTPSARTKYSCFGDTLPLWQVGVKNYVTNFNVKLFPNPAYATTNLFISSVNNEKYTAKVFSIFGEEVMNFKINSNIETAIDLSNLSSGTYFIKVLNQNNTILSTIKFSLIN